MTTPHLLPSGEPLDAFLERIEVASRGVFARLRVPYQEAEDLFQEAVLALLEKSAEVRDAEAWFLTTLRNRCLLYWRRRRRSFTAAVDTVLLEAFEDGEKSPEESAELRCDLSSALGRISERCRELLERRYRQGDEPREVAERLGYRPGSIARVTQRCLSALGAQLLRGGYGDIGVAGAAAGSVRTEAAALRGGRSPEGRNHV